MKTITTTAMLALMTAAIGLSAAAPGFAQDAPPPAAQGEMQKGPHGGRNDGPGMRGPHDGPGMHGPRGDNGPGRGMGMGGPRGMLDFSNPDSVEIGMVLLSQRIDPTPEQQPLFDTFKTDAMAAATTFQAALEAARPAAPLPAQSVSVPILRTCSIPASPSPPPNSTLSRLSSPRQRRSSIA